MGKVISINTKNIRAAASDDGVPSFWINGVVGYDFTGLDLAAVASQLGEVRFLLDTVGGDAADAFAFYDAVRTKGLKVHVEGYGRVMSAGTVIMAAAGLKRSSLAPNAEYLIHEASGGDAKAVERYNERMARIYSELSGMSEKEIRKIMKRDEPISAQEAKKLKLVGTVLQHEAIAAQFNKMEENTGTPEAIEEVAPVVTETVTDDPAPETTNEAEEVEQEVAVTVKEAIEAAMRGHIKVRIGKEMSEAVNALADEVKGLTTERDELKSEIEALGEKLTASEDARTTAEAKATEMEPKLAEITAQLETLRATPVAEAKEGTEAKEVQVPGGGPSTTDSRQTKAEKKAKQREESMRSFTALMNPKTEQA